MTIFSHPDYTVGAGITPAQFKAFALKLRALTAGRELPPENGKPLSEGSPRPENLILILGNNDRLVKVSYCHVAVEAFIRR